MASQADQTPAVVVVKGASDIGSAVAHALRQAGWNPVLVEGSAPGVTRRRMAFAPAVYEGRAELEGLVGIRCAGAGEAVAWASDPGVVPLLVADTLDPVEGLTPAAVVDARMRKRHEPPVQIREAPLSLGIGPGFVCGHHVHGVIESNWGPRLGQVLWQGASQAYTGKHREVEGFGRERYVYAPIAGRFRTERNVLEPVRPGDTIAWVDDVPLKAEIGGVLRGLAYSGRSVAAGAKLIEIDPTGNPAGAIGIGARQRAIAAGVVAGLLQPGPLFQAIG